MPYKFTPPTYRFKASTDSLFGKRWVDVGQSVLKFGQSYRLTRNVSAEDVEAADRAYIGGRTYIVDDDEATDLREAGYGSALYPVEAPSIALYPSEDVFPGEAVFPGTPMVHALFASIGLYPSEDLFPGDDQS